MIRVQRAGELVAVAPLLHQHLLVVVVAVAVMAAAAAVAAVAMAAAAPSIGGCSMNATQRRPELPGRDSS
jgi:hypothetical protein